MHPCSSIPESWREQDDESQVVCFTCCSPQSQSPSQMMWTHCLKTVSRNLFCHTSSLHLWCFSRRQTHNPSLMTWLSRDLDRLSVSSIVVTVLVFYPWFYPWFYPLVLSFGSILWRYVNNESATIQQKKTTSSSLTTFLPNFCQSFTTCFLFNYSSSLQANLYHSCLLFKSIETSISSNSLK